MELLCSRNPDEARWTSTKIRQPTIEMEASEEEQKEIAQEVATGVVTPAPGLQAQPTTPGVTLTMSGSAAAPRTPTSGPAKRRLDEEEKTEEEKGGKRQDATESPRKSAEKIISDDAEETQEKRGRREQETNPPESRMLRRRNQQVHRECHQRTI